MKTVLSAVAVAVVLGLSASVALAYHCPLLVKECRAVVAKMEQRADTDKAIVAEAKKGCEEALKLHEAGNHKGGQTKAGEAIALTGKALK